MNEWDDRHTRPAFVTMNETPELPIFCLPAPSPSTALSPSPSNYSPPIRPLEQETLSPVTCLRHPTTFFYPFIFLLGNRKLLPALVTDFFE